MLIECNYITPCGWCEKWDKKCDLKVKEATQFKLKELELEKIKQEFERAKQEIDNSYRVIIKNCE